MMLHVAVTLCMRGTRSEPKGCLFRRTQSSNEAPLICTTAMAPENVFHPIFVAILMRREDQTLQNYINIWIDQIEMDGTLAKIRTKWLGS